MWWEEHPERLEFELDSLQYCGIQFEVLEEHLEKDQVYALNLTLEHDGDEFRVLAVFPDEYPGFRPRVFLKKGPELKRHLYAQSTGR